MADGILPDGGVLLPRWHVRPETGQKPCARGAGALLIFRHSRVTANNRSSSGTAALHRVPSRTAVPTPVQTAIHVVPTPRPTHAQLFSPFNHSDIQTVPPRRSASCLRCSIQSWSTAGLGMFALTSAHTQSCAEPRLCIRTYCVRTRSTGHETARGS